MSPARIARTPGSRVNRYAVFLILIVLSELAPALPHAITPNTEWWLASIGFIVLMVLAGALGARRVPAHWLNTVAPLLLLPAIWTLRAADGNAASGFSLLIFLPVVWFALYGRLREVLIAVIGGALTVLLPMIIVGAPQYPTSNWRGYVLMVIMTAALGPLIHRLVTTKAQADSAVARSEREFRAAFEDAPIGMAFIGLRGDSAHRFIRVNRALSAMLGRTIDELTGLDIRTITHPDDIERTRMFDDGEFDSSRSGRVEKRYLHPSGRIIWASQSFSVINDEQGEPSHLISQIEDLGERRASEQALLDAFQADLEANEMLVRLDRMRSDMASTVSHEMRTPLTSAAGYVELLTEGDAGPLTDEQRTMLATVARSLTRLDSIVDDVLGLTDAAHVQRREVGTADLGAVIDSALSTIALQAAARGLNLVVHNTLAGIHVRGDAGRIERAVVNILTNAVKFTSANGTVTVRSEHAGSDACIAITDTGIGISKEDQQHIFERYFRAERRRDDANTPGTGLGLAIVSAIMNQYGGTIAVQSELGAGSTFTLTFPLLTDTKLTDTNLAAP